MKSTLSKVVLGLLFIAVGIGYLGNELDWWNFTIWFDGWWTLFIIVPAVLSICNSGIGIGNLITLGVGLALLLSQLDVFEINSVWSIFIPAGLVLIGLGIIFGPLKQHDRPVINKNGDTPNETAIFGGREPNYSNLEFKGTNCTAIFGGVELNLRNAIISENCEIVCYCVCGGIDIHLPPNVRVIMNITPILGGSESKYMSSPDTNAPTVSIIGTVIMGGVDVK